MARATSIRLIRRPLAAATFVGLVLATLAALLPAGAATPEAAAAVPDPSTVTVRFTQRASGLVQPVLLTTARDGTGRNFIVEKPGRIRVWRNGALLATPYLDIRDLVDDTGEGGLLGLAYSPTFRTTPYVWVSYTDATGTFRVARFQASTYSATTLDRTTRREVLSVPHPTYRNHYGGHLAFDPSTGYLFVSTGDGGGAGDPLDNARDLTSLSGKMLRIDVRSACGGRLYCIPSTNPYATSTTARKEIWLSGLRNPWRYSFDRANANLWIGDVGQSEQEEVDYLARGTGAGRNLGWPCREGRLVYDSTRCSAAITYYEPQLVYGRGEGRSVTGGYVYRGAQYATLLAGLYVFGDFSSGQVWVYQRGGRRVAQGALLPQVTSFGEDGANELWAVTLDGRLWSMTARAKT